MPTWQTDATLLHRETPTRVNRQHLNASVAPLLSCGLMKGGPRYRTTRPHGRSDWLIILTMEGCGVFRNDGRTHQATPQGLMIYLDGTPQDYGTSSQSGLWTFAFAHVQPRPMWLRLVASWPAVWPGMVVVTIDDPLPWAEAWRAMAHARQLVTSPHRGGEELTRNAIEAALLWAEEANPAHGPLPDPRIRRAADFARAHAHQRITAEQMAARAGLSPSRFAALFRRQMGESPVSYAERLRLERAANLIATAGLTVKEAAAAAGYDDPFQFSRRFACRLGSAPSRWRTAGPTSP